MRESEAHSDREQGQLPNSNEGRGKSLRMVTLFSLWGRRHGAPCAIFGSFPGFLILRGRIGTDIWAFRKVIPHLAHLDRNEAVRGCHPTPRVHAIQPGSCGCWIMNLGKT